MKKKIIIGAVLLLIIVGLVMVFTSKGFKKGFKEGIESTQSK